MRKILVVFGVIETSQNKHTKWKHYRKSSDLRKDRKNSETGTDAEMRAECKTNSQKEETESQEVDLRIPMVDEDSKRSQEEDEGSCEAKTRIHSSPQIHAKEDG